MNGHLQKPLAFPAVCLAFLATVTAAVALNQMGWLAVPLLLLLCLWAFEKPLLLLYVLLASIPWSVEYRFSETLGIDFPDEPLMLLTAWAVLSLLVYNCKTLQKKSVRHPLLVLLALQLFWALVTVTTSTHPLLSLKYAAAKGWYLFAFVLAPLLLFDTKQKLKTAALVLVLSMMLLVGVALARHAAAGFAFDTINQSLAPFFRNHVNYSALLVCIVPVLVVFAKLVAVRASKNVLHVLLVAALAALYFSYARGAWAALAAGIVAYGLLKKKALVTAFFIAIFLWAAAVAWLQHNNRYLQYAHNYNTTIFHTDFSEHLVATYQLKDLSTAERFYRWVAGARMARERWQTGFGPNTFYHNYKSYTVPAFKTWVSGNEEHSTVHNYFLLLLIEQGVFGLLLFLALLAVAFYKAQHIYHTTTDPFWKATAAAIAVILVMICTVNFLSDLIETDKIGSVFYLCLAALMIADRKVGAVGTSHLATHIERIA